MKILLINDNPVVNKLVTLSAQKTSDELDIVAHIQEVNNGSYDLVIVDDSIAEAKDLATLKQKIAFKKSLYICTRDASAVDGFDSTLKKPFLPTDLVELFVMFEKEIDKEPQQEVEKDIADLDTIEDLDELDDLGELDNLEELDDLETLDDDFEDVALDEQIALDTETLDLDLDLQEDDVLTLDEDDDETLINETSLDDTDLGESVLDDEEAQKVKDLLDETSLDLALDLEDEGDVVESLDDFELSEEPEAPQETKELEDIVELELPEEIEEPVELEDLEDLEEIEEPSELEDVEDVEEPQSFEEDMVLEDEAEELEMPKELEEVVELELPAEIQELEEPEEVESEILPEPEEVREEKVLPIEEDADLETQIQNAVEDLSDEDLESEVDDETLLEIAANEIDSLDNLTSKDLKLALGEEITPQEEVVTSDELEEIVDESVEAFSEEESNEEESTSQGVEKLKKLLEALSDKDVVASLKGMKISINIELDSK